MNNYYFVYDADNIINFKTIHEETKIFTQTLARLTMISIKLMTLQQYKFSLKKKRSTYALQKIQELHIYRKFR